MENRYTSLALAAALAACPALAVATVVTPDAKPTAEQAAAVQKALSPDERDQSYVVATADLNGDGRPDLIGQFTSGMYCGALGCTGFAVLANGHGFASHSIDLPNFMGKVTVLNSRHHGMRDLRFDDSRYVFKWTGKGYR